MNLRDLRYVVALADLKHFGKAAEACNVSQPTLSTQLKNLESLLGVALFERDSKQVTVTEIGAAIVARARSIIADADTIVTLARGRADVLDMPFRLGVIPTLCPYFLPWFVPTIRAVYPEAKLVVSEDLTSGLVERLANHQLDAAIAAMPFGGAGLHSQDLFEEPFWFACHKTHGLADHASVTDDDLSREDILVLTEGHCLREQALAACHAVAAGNGSDFRATSLATLRQMVQGGFGNTLLPALATVSLEDDIRVLPLENPVSRRIAIAWRSGSSRTDDIQALVSSIVDSLPAGVVALR